MEEKRTWTCPRCGRESDRAEGEDRRRCVCGSLMEATISFDDAQKKTLERLED